MISKAKGAPTVSRSISNVPRAAARPMDSRNLTEVLSESPLASATTPLPATTPALVFGGSGYVAGELLRLLSNHPRFAPAAVFSTTQAGESVTRAFPHLAGTRLDGVNFSAEEEGAESDARSLWIGEAADHELLALNTFGLHPAAVTAGTIRLIAALRHEDRQRKHDHRGCREPRRYGALEDLRILRPQCTAVRLRQLAHARASLPNSFPRNQPVVMSITNTVMMMVMRMALTSE
jgi:hypothetical protein